MRLAVVHDSAYGNTATLAGAIASALESYGEVFSVRVDKIKKADLSGVDLLIIGSPTQGGRPTKPIEKFLKELPSDLTQYCAFAVFDTRFEVKEQKKALQMLMKFIGYAAPKMAKTIKQAGGHVIDEPRGYIVSDSKGPLKVGELEDATAWAQGLAQQITKT